MVYIGLSKKGAWNMPSKIRQTSQPVPAEWVFNVAQEFQLIAGEIAFGSIQSLEGLDKRISQAAKTATGRFEQIILRGLLSEAMEQLRRPPSGVVLPAAVQAAQLLRDRCTEDWTGDRLARQVGSNRYDLYRGFRALHGTTPHQYHALCRLEFVQREVAKGEKVEAAALLAGYRNRSSYYYARTHLKLRRLETSR